MISKDFKFQLSLILQSLQVDFKALPQSYSSSSECLWQPRAPSLQLPGFVNDDSVGLEWRVADWKAVGGTAASSEDKLINYCSVCSYANIKASGRKGSLISSSVPFQVVPFILPSKCWLLSPLISRENSNKRDLQPHPPNQWWAVEGLGHHPEYTVSSLHLSIATGSCLQSIQWYPSFPCKRNSYIQIQKCSQQHYW